MTAITALLIILSVPLWGYFIFNNPATRPGVAGWAIVVVFNACIYFFVQAPPPLLMLLYIANTFLGFKIVMANNRLGRPDKLSFIQWCLFNYAWFGMNPAPFTALPAKPLPDHISYYKIGLSRMVAGLLLINTGYFITPLLETTAFNFIVHLLYLVGLSLILHFGILKIAAGFLRGKGIHVTSLFKDPIQSKSLEEFWSKRWNIAFVELTTIAVLRPVKKRYGAGIAFWISFLFSGLLHELAISLPVKSGFGKPLLYFIIQAVLIMVVEKRIFRHRPEGLPAKCWLLASVLLPVFLLFHKDFIQQVIIPLVHYLVFIR